MSYGRWNLAPEGIASPRFSNSTQNVGYDRFQSSHGFGSNEPIFYLETLIDGLQTLQIVVVYKLSIMGFE